MNKEAMKLALEALELNDAPLNNETVVLWEQKIDEAIIALREALASEAIEQPAHQQEPMVRFCPDCGHLQGASEPATRCCPDWIRARIVPRNFAETCRATFNRAIERAHGIKENI